MDNSNLNTNNNKYKIFGDDIQAVEVDLAPKEAIKAEAGAFLYMDAGITMDTKFEGGLGGIFKRMISGESITVPYFINNAEKIQKVSFAAPYPGKIIPINLKAFGGKFLCQRDAFLCADVSTDISIAFTKRIGAGFFGGEGFILQKLVGEGMAFIHSGGTIIERDLAEAEILKVDTGCLVAFEESIDYDVEFVKGIKNIFFGGEGLFVTTLKGPGKVYLQSLPFSRIADRILESANYKSGVSESGGAIGQIVGGLFDGQ